MKKFLSVILAIAVIFSFSAFIGCTNGETEPSAPVTSESAPTAAAVSKEPEETIDLKNSKPNEYIEEKLFVSKNEVFKTPKLSLPLCDRLSSFVHNLRFYPIIIYKTN